MTDHSHHRDNRGGAGRWVFWGFVLIAAFFLLMEHRAHLFQYLPFLLVLACPLMHFLHGHGGDGGHGGAPEGKRKDSDATKAGGENKPAGGCH